MQRKTLLSWSSGKDSAWSLHMLRQDPAIEVVGLFCTVNMKFNRVAMHGVRVELLQQQAIHAGLPLHIIPIPYPCSNADYDAVMTEFVAKAKQDHIECFAFGDLYLEDIRKYREARLRDTGITPSFPLWGMPTNILCRAMVDAGLKAMITCVDPKRLAQNFAGREYNAEFINDLPVSVDPCGENGEFHSFAFAGPMFSKPIEITLGEIVQRDGFVFADLLPAEFAAANV